MKNAIKKLIAEYESKISLENKIVEEIKAEIAFHRKNNITTEDLKEDRKISQARRQAYYQITKDLRDLLG